MQAPEDSAASGSLYASVPPEATLAEATTPSPHHSWLGSQEIASSTGKSNVSAASWQWQVGGAITGTAVVSAGLAMPFVSEQAISIPLGETYLPQGQTANEINSTLADRHTAQTVAFSQGQGISPHAGETQRALFSHPSQTGFSPTRTSNVLTSENPASPTISPAVLPTTEPQLVRDGNGSWKLTYTDSSSNAATHSLPTQAVVNQLVTQNRAQRTCSGPTCRSLDYIQTQLPAAQQDVTDLQAQLTVFEEQHGQSDLKAYQATLAARISEITDQKTKIALQRSANERYVSQIKVRLATIDVSPELPAHLLAIDTNYQTHWLQLQQTERRLLDEFSRASVDAAALNQIYARYEQQQIDLYQSAQAVLGNYLLSTDQGSPTGNTSVIPNVPVALDLLQALTVATHQQEVQQLRDRTVQLATEKLQTRHRQLAENISQYEALQRELNIAQQLVAQYEQESDRITAEAAATQLIATPAANSTTSRNASVSPAFATAQALEAKTPEGSIGKTLLGIVMAAGAVAVAAQRRAGDVSEAFALEIAPNPKQKRFGLAPAHKRVSNPVRADLLNELLEMTGQRRPALAIAGSTLALDIPVNDNLLPPRIETHKRHTGNTLAIKSVQPPTVHLLPAASQIAPEYPHQDHAADRDLTHQLTHNLQQEMMSRELAEIVTQSAPEVRFAQEISQRSIEPVSLSLDEIDAFAESAVRWVLNDLNFDFDFSEGTLSQPPKETVEA